MKKMQQILVEVRQKLAEEIAVTDEDEIKQFLKISQRSVEFRDL